MSNQAENYRRAADTIQFRQFMLYKKILRLIMINLTNIEEMKKYQKLTGANYAGILESNLTAIHTACKDALDHNNKRIIIRYTA